MNSNSLILLQVSPSFHLVYLVVLATIWLLVSALVLSFDAFCGTACLKMVALAFWGVWNIVIIYMILLSTPSQVRSRLNGMYYGHIDPSISSVEMCLL